MDAPQIPSNQWTTLWAQWSIKIGLHISYTLSDLDLYIMTLSELCLKGIVWKASPYYIIFVAYGKYLF
jgi:hypothetical protein